MWEPYWAREQAGWLLIDALDRGVLTLDEVVTPNPVSTRPAYVSRVGDAVRRGLHAVAARFSRRRQPGSVRPGIEREVDDLLHALDLGSHVSVPSSRAERCHP